MANYGPPGGPYPGPPPEPWPDPHPQADDEYGPPADPWGEHDQSAGHAQSSGHGAPAVPGQHPAPDYPPTRRHDVGYPSTPHHPGESAPFAVPPAGWTPPSGSDPVWAPQAGDPNWSSSAPQPPRKRGRGRIFVGVLVTLAVLVVAGAAIGVYLLGPAQKPTPGARPTAGPTEGPSYQSSPPAGPTPTKAAPERSTDARFVKAGQCVANEGSEEAPQLLITNCAPQTYEVLERYNGATTGKADAKTKCAKVRNYTNFYFFNSELDELDFVLCLKKR